jgi:hypothetical protein
VLGALMLDPSVWARVCGLLSAEDFYRPDHAIIFGAIQALALAGKPHDWLLVAEQLELDDQLEKVGGRAHVVKLATETPCADNVEAYAGHVRERAQLRRFLEFGPAIERAIADGCTPQEVCGQLRASLERMEAVLPQAQRPAETLAVEPVSAWASRPAPAPRDWIIEGLVPARRVTSFLADGGLGKTTIAVQIGVHVTLNRALYGLNVSGGPVLGIFCEDEQDELHRRIAAACFAEGLELADLDRFTALSRDGQDNLLCTFQHDQIVLTPFYQQLDATVASIRPRLLILDVLADFFAGDYLSTPHTRQFIKTCLGGLAVRYDCGVLLLAHPSASGMNSGDGGGFSTAWNNSVRSRLYLRRPKSDDPEAVKDKRILEVRKSNYAPGGVSVPLVWCKGVFLPDPEPLAERSATPQVAKVDTRLAIAVREHFCMHAPSGSVVGFRTLFDALQASGALPAGNYETVRKPLQRALKELERAEIISCSQVPRGYRYTENLPGLRGHSGDKDGTSGTLGTRGQGDTPIRGVSPMSPDIVPSEIIGHMRA